jgi:hypothetical protein
MNKRLLVLCLGWGVGVTAALNADVTIKGQNGASDVTIKNNGTDVTINGGAVTVQPTAQSTQTVNTAQAPAQTYEWTSLEGNVTQVDQQNRTLTMQLKGTTTQVAIPVDNTKIMAYKNNQLSDIKDIHPGDNVTVKRVM